MDPDLAIANAAPGRVFAQKIEQQRRDQTPLNNQAGMPLDESRKRAIVMNAARIPSERGVPKKRLRLRMELSPPVGFSPGHPRLDRVPSFPTRHVNKAPLFRERQALTVRDFMVEQKRDDLPHAPWTLGNVDHPRKARDRISHSHRTVKGDPAFDTLPMRQLDWRQGRIEKIAIFASLRRSPPRPKIEPMCERRQLVACLRRGFGEIEKIKKSGERRRRRAIRANVDPP